MLQFNQHMKSDKMSYIIYANLASLIKKVDGCGNNTEKSSITKIDEHIPCGYLMSTIWVFGRFEVFLVGLKRAQISSRCNDMLHLWKKILKTVS